MNKRWEIKRENKDGEKSCPHNKAKMTSQPETKGKDDERIISINISIKCLLIFVYRSTET